MASSLTLNAVRAVPVPGDGNACSSRETVGGSGYVQCRPGNPFAACVVRAAGQGSPAVGADGGQADDGARCFSGRKAVVPGICCVHETSCRCSLTTINYCSVSVPITCSALADLCTCLILWRCVVCTLQKNTRTIGRKNGREASINSVAK